MWKEGVRPVAQCCRIGPRCGTALTAVAEAFTVYCTMMVRHVIIMNQEDCYLRHLPVTKASSTKPELNLMHAGGISSLKRRHAPDGARCPSPDGPFLYNIHDIDFDAGGMWKEARNAVSSLTTPFSVGLVKILSRMSMSLTMLGTRLSPS